ncbi:MAG: hypothetical protein ACTSQS_11000 [Promethearchaeota archaeon]
MKLSKHKKSKKVEILFLFFIIMLSTSFFINNIDKSKKYNSNTKNDESNSKQIDDLKFSGKEINITTPKNKTYILPNNGYYPGTYGFENDGDGSVPYNWVNNSGNGCEAQVISNFNGHNKVLRVFDNHNLNIANMIQNFGSGKMNGIIEFWGSAAQTDKNITYLLKDDSSNRIVYLGFLSSGNFGFFNSSGFVDSGISYSANSWYRFQIKFDCVLNNFSWYVFNQFGSGVLSQKNEPFFENDNGGGADLFSIETISTQINSLGYFDALGYSWDDNYTIGDNANWGFLLSFEISFTPDWFGYSLDGRNNITIFGNTTIPMPSIGSHKIQVFGNDTLGNDYKSDIRFFAFRGIRLNTPENQKEYTSPMSGYYPGTYGFEEDQNGAFGTAINYIDSVNLKAFCEVSVADSYQGHKRVLFFRDGTSLANFSALHNFSASQTSGVIEFWWLLTPTFEPFNTMDIAFRSSSGQLGFNLSVKDGYYLDSYGLNASRYYTNKWYHHKIVFDCNAGTNGRYSWYIDGINVVNDQEFVNNINNLDKIQFFGISPRRVEAYFDAISFSWDPNYNINDNLEEGLLIGYDTSVSLVWTGYSLDGNPNITIINNETIVVPSNSQHSITVYGKTSGGTTYQSNTNYFSVNISKYMNLITPKNDTYSGPMSGYYFGSYSFENDENDYDPYNWLDLSGSGSSVKVISELGGHKKVLELDDQSGNSRIDLNNVFNSSQVAGTVEFWVRVKDDSTRPLNLWLTEANNNSKGLRLFIGKLGAFYWHNGTDYNYIDSCDFNKWYHIRIEFNVSSKWHLWIDGVSKDGGAGYDFVGSPTSLGKFHCTTSHGQSGYTAYLDAIGYSWDTQYNIGDNYKQGLLIGFKSNINFEWIKYSLNGQKNRTIYGNKTIKMPQVGNHKIQLFGKDINGNNYKTKVRFFRIIDPVAPTIEGPPSSLTFEQFSIHTIQWNITEVNDGSYVIKRNGTIVKAGLFMNWVNVSIQVDTNFTGYWNYTIIASDPSNNKGNHTVIIHIIDISDPIIEGISGLINAEQASLRYLEWNITEINNGTYTIYRNGTVVGSGSFYNWINVSIEVNTQIIKLLKQ